MSNDEKKWFSKITHWFDRIPENLGALNELLHELAEEKILAPETLSMLEGVLQLADLKIAQIMVPRMQMVSIAISESLESFIPKIVASGHSRFPVFDDKYVEIKGILFAKDLLQLLEKSRISEEFEMDEFIRPPMIVPETQRLETLLDEFKRSHQHMAIVVDEYGAVAGLVTIEDVLEQIVGEIDDEHDPLGEEIFIKEQPGGVYFIKTKMPLEDFNQYFGTHFSLHQASTLGGFLLNQWHRLPRRNEHLRIGGLHFTIIRSDHRRIYLVSVRKE